MNRSCVLSLILKTPDTLLPNLPRLSVIPSFFGELRFFGLIWNSAVLNWPVRTDIHLPSIMVVRPLNIGNLTVAGGLNSTKTAPSGVVSVHLSPLISWFVPLTKLRNSILSNLLIVF